MNRSTLSYRTLVSALFFFIACSCLPAPAAERCSVTQNDVEGPYYLPGAPVRSTIASPDEPGTGIRIHGTVMGDDCETPVKDAVIEVWQTDATGRYHYAEEDFRLRGQLKTDQYGRFAFNSIKPGRYRIRDGFRPAHIHIKVSHPDYRVLTTQVYFRGDPYLWPNDACGSTCRSDDPHRIIALSRRSGSTVELFSGVLPVFLEKKEVLPESPHRGK